MANRDRDGQSRSLALSAEPSSPRAARQLVHEACRDWQVDNGLCNDAALVASELVANVVDHARTECVLIVGRDGAGLRIEVEDYFPSAGPVLLPVDPTALRGRGLQMIAAISSAWGVTELGGGKAVWAIVTDGVGP